ncbi:MAG TPA: hypothetical protein VJY39_00560 [Acidisphaera sp.]|nr:hypothetical protein [Acidisphaera sp.]
MSERDRPVDDQEIEVTEEMAKVGADELSSWGLPESQEWEAAAAAVYRGMRAIADRVQARKN